MVVSAVIVGSIAVFSRCEGAAQQATGHWCAEHSGQAAPQGQPILCAAATAAPATAEAAAAAATAALISLLALLV